jgi:hypothetical protein
MSLRSCGNRWRSVSQEYNLAGVLNPYMLATFAARLLT